MKKRLPDTGSLHSRLKFFSSSLIHILYYHNFFRLQALLSTTHDLKVGGLPLLVNFCEKEKNYGGRKEKCRRYSEKCAS
jgi:hypothetical protein